jgi:hypothetical protein
MKRALLILSLVLMTASLTAPFWFRWTTGIPRKRIEGRVTGDFADQPWVGAAVYVADKRSSLKADGKFAFDVPPGVYVVRVCCSQRFDPIRWEVQVKDENVYVDLHAEPLVDVPGRLVIPEGNQGQSLASVAARRIFTRVVKRTVVSAGGTFSLRLSRGDWKVSVENVSPELTPKSILFGGKEVRDETITISNRQESALPLEITLQPSLLP